jgi:hypothetical protein
MSEPSFTLFDTDTGATILKWAITILVAGFIAQFGKKFATFLMEKIKRFRTRKAAARDPQAPGAELPQAPQESRGETLSSVQLEAHRADLKLNKKMIKALAKERKKK